MGNSKQELVNAYGDTLNDGMIQLSFTLPIECGPRAQKAAEVFATKLNLTDVSVVSYHKISENFTHFVVYGKSSVEVDFGQIHTNEIEIEVLDFYDINSLIKENIGRPLTVVGGTIGTDAHTVGIDAIMNMKGFNGNYGLERYPEFNAINMGAQIPIEQLLSKSIQVKADCILVSQTVTQKDSHIKNFTALAELLEKEKVRDQFLLIMGGPRVNNELAIELGFDAGFGANTTPAHVATYIYNELIKKKG